MHSALHSTLLILRNNVVVYFRNLLTLFQCSIVFLLFLSCFSCSCTYYVILLCSFSLYCVDMKLWMDLCDMKYINSYWQMIDYEVTKEAEEHATHRQYKITIEWQELEMLACVLTSVCLVRETATRQTQCIEAFDTRPLRLRMNDLANTWSIATRPRPIDADPNFS